MKLYTHSRERSAELLRTVLAVMTALEAELNPQAYVVWHEYVAGMNPALSFALKALLRERAPMDDALATSSDMQVSAVALRGLVVARFA